ncbi:MAG: hypothetical protein ACKO3N_19865 [Verrucomicrobiota bacterium]
MKRFLSAVNRVLLGAGLFLLLGRPAGAFDYLYSPTNLPAGVTLNGSATIANGYFQLTQDSQSLTGGLVIDNLPRVPIKSFTVKFGLRTKTASSVSGSSSRIFRTS